MSARLMILNGPNLNLLGVREPHIYGSTTLAAIEASCAAFAEYIGASLTFEQSNHEGHLVDLIQSARQSSDAIIINPAGYSFTSIAIYDALKAFDGPIIEVHISKHPCPRRASSVFEAVERGEGRHLRPGPIWLHCRHAGCRAHA